MTIVAGMLLTCMVKVSSPGVYGSFIKDVPTKVLHVFADRKEALVEYDFDKAPGIKYLGDYHDQKQTELVGLVDLQAKTYMNCKAR